VGAACAWCVGERAFSSRSEYGCDKCSYRNHEYTVNTIVIRRRNKKNKGTSPIERGGVCVSRSTNSTYRVSASMPVFPQGRVDYKIELHA